MNAPKILGYFVLADRGIKTANVLLAAGQLEDAALNIQQIVERVARALLTHADQAFGTSHNLSQMAASLPVGHSFAKRINAFDDLSPAVTAFRYPTDGGRLKKAPPPDVLKAKLNSARELVHDAKLFVYGDPKHWPAEIAAT